MMPRTGAGLPGMTSRHIGIIMVAHTGARSSLQERLDFVGLDPESCNRLRKMKPFIAKAIGPAAR